MRSTAPPTSAELAREGIPISTLPGRASETEASRGTALIGKSLLVKGQLFGREDLIVDGELDGSLELQEHRLTIGPNGKVQANIKAREVVVVGTVHGNIEATEKIDIRKDAKLVGDIRTARIMIEDGAYFKGSIDIQKPEVSRPPAAPRPQTAAAAAAPQQQPLSVNPSPPEVKR
ncbi:MAG TPA: polymer-forming cytoskeletal protein [Bryobacteraceae bacterium]|nr:polymer-forming cytoskeletal protein [Bryobacteraceae bacterium]